MCDKVVETVDKKHIHAVRHTKRCGQLSAVLGMKQQGVFKHKRKGIKKVYKKTESTLKLPVFKCYIFRVICYKHYLS